MNQAKTLQEMLQLSTDRDPDQVVFIHRKRRTSYAELSRISDNLAGGLREHGIKRGDRVVLVLNNTLEYLAAYYGILKAGAVVVPHYTDTRTRTLAYVINHCEASALIMEGRNTRLLDGQAEQVPSLRLVVSHGRAQMEAPGHLRVVDLGELLQVPPLPGGLQGGGDDLATIVYTSGTTGHPKGVMLAHRNMLANIRSIVAYLELTPRDIIAMVLPFFYVYGNSVLQTHIFAGGTIAQVGTMAFPAAVLQGIQEERCSGMSGVPSTFARLFQFSAMESYDLRSLRYLTQAGGPMTPALTQKLRAALPWARVFVMYGQTEASARLSYLPPEELERKLGSAGKAIPDVTLAIVDVEGNELPRGQPGEIVARGENIMLGYWDNPEETARALRPEGLRTGDLAWMDEEGYLFIVGRETDMIKSGAHRIGPKEIEDVVEMLPQVAECAVTGVPDEILGEAIAAFVVPIKGEEVEEKQVLRLCHEHLPRFKMPSFVRIVDTLPRTPSGKIRRRELKGWFAASATPRPEGA